MGDISLSYGEHDKLEEFCTLFNLQSLNNKEIYYTNNHTSIINLILTYKPNSFPNSSVTGTGLSKYHKLLETFFQVPF